jgi:hypothetical protein
MLQIKRKIYISSRFPIYTAIAAASDWAACMHTKQADEGRKEEKEAAERLIKAYSIGSELKQEGGQEGEEREEEEEEGEVAERDLESPGVRRRRHGLLSFPDCVRNGIEEEEEEEEDP